MKIKPNSCKFHRTGFYQTDVPRDEILLGLHITIVACQNELLFSQNQREKQLVLFYLSTHKNWLGC